MIIEKKPKFAKALTNILRRITNDKPLASIKFEQEIDRRIKGLIDFPYQYRPSYYFENKAYRDMVYSGYTIIYKVTQEKIMILEIFKWQERYRGEAVVLAHSSGVVTISHLIEMSVAPVFLIAGVAGLLNVFVTRLARAIDRLEALDEYNSKQHRQNSAYKEPDYIHEMREILLRRMRNSNRAIFFATITGLMVAIVIICVFTSALLGVHTEGLIAVLFILAMVSFSRIFEIVKHLTSRHIQFIVRTEPVEVHQT